ncbi:MAG: SurA N-terminal domain-containing protein [Candidatus Babeliaceae bacterium]|nr:SurA N-terminal domain-containing protein [Candidatus Babeliaceae bacterium]
MILFIRKYFHKRLMQGLIMVMIFSLIGIGSFSQIVNVFFSDSHYAFTVNGYGVPKQLFELRVSIEKKIIDFYKLQLGDLAPRFLAQAGMNLSPEKNAYNKIVRELVLSSAMVNSGLFVSTRAIAQKIQDPVTTMNLFGSTFPKALYDRNGKIQEDILIRLLAKMGLTLQDFEKVFEEAIERDLAFNLFHLATPVTKKELDVHCLKEFGKRDFTLITYRIDNYLKKARKEEVSQEVLQTFFSEKNAQSRAYWTKEKRNGISWKIPVTEKNKEKVTEEGQRALKGDEKSFNAFLEKYKGQKNLILEAESSQKNSMLFQLEINNKGIYHEDGCLMIVMPTHVVPAQEKQLKDIEKQVAEDYYLSVAQKAMIGDLEGAGVSDEDIVSTQKFTLKPETLDSEIEKLTQKSFSGDRIKNMVTEGSRLRGLRQQGGYVVILDRAERPQIVTPEQYRAAENAILKENERLITAASVDSLLKNAKIKNNKL